MAETEPGTGQPLEAEPLEADEWLDTLDFLRKIEARLEEAYTPEATRRQMAHAIRDALDMIAEWPDIGTEPS